MVPLRGSVPLPNARPIPNGRRSNSSRAMASATTTPGAKLTQRFGRNLTTLFSFTRSKALDENSAIRGTGNDFAPENPHCRSCDLGPAGFNVPRRFVASILYALPFGKGQTFLNHGGIVNHAFGGWQLSTITTVQDGP